MEEESLRNPCCQYDFMMNITWVLKRLKGKHGNCQRLSFDPYGWKNDTHLVTKSFPVYFNLKGIVIIVSVKNFL